MTEYPFEASAPAFWKVHRGDDGLTLLGPRGAGGIAAQINLRYIPPGHGLYKDADAYLERLTRKPEVEMPGWKTGAVEKTLVAGRPSRRLARDTSEFVPRSSMNTKEIPMKEIHVVVPAKKGFYVLFYFVPRDIDAKSRAAWTAVLKSFKPRI